MTCTPGKTQIHLGIRPVWSESSLGALWVAKVGWLCWGLTSQSTIFQSCRDGAIASWVINQYFRGVKCLAQGLNTAAVGLEPRTSRYGVRHSTTEPPRSRVAKDQIFHHVDNEDSDQTGWMPRLIWIFSGRTALFVGFVVMWLKLNNICHIWIRWTFSIHHCWSVSMTKPTKWPVRPSKTQISLGMRPVWSESSLGALWVDKDQIFHHADKEDSDQTGWMHRMIWSMGARVVSLFLSGWGSD